MSDLGRQIEAFRAVMLTGGMTTAAETLHITQPAVSRLIRDLEHDLQIQLFHRKGNQITPSVEATAFLAAVERSYIGLGQLKAYATDLRQSLAGSLRITAMPAMALGFLPYCVAAFTSSRPKLSVSLDGIPSHLVLDRVMGGQFEIGFAEGFSDRPTLRMSPMRASLVVVLPEGHPLGAHEVLTAEQLLGERVVMLGQGSYIRHTIEQALGALGRHWTIETPLSAIACSLVSKGLGVSIVDPFTAVGFMNRGIIVRPLSPELDVGFSIVTASHIPMSRIGADFAREVPSLAEKYLEPILQHRRR